MQLLGRKQILWKWWVIDCKWIVNLQHEAFQIGFYREQQHQQGMQNVRVNPVIIFWTSEQLKISLWFQSLLKPEAAKKHADCEDNLAWENQWQLSLLPTETTWKYAKLLLRWRESKENYLVLLSEELPAFQYLKHTDHKAY